jgi:hypothetical protein
VHCNGYHLLEEAARGLSDQILGEYVLEFSRAVGGKLEEALSGYLI